MAGRDWPVLDRLRPAIACAAHLPVGLAAVQFAGAPSLGWTAALGRDAAARRATLLEPVSARIMRLLVVGMDVLFDVVCDATNSRLRLRRAAGLASPTPKSVAVWDGPRLEPGHPADDR